MSSLIAGRYPVGIGVGGVFFPSTLQHLHQQQQHQHHSRLAAASSALSNAVQVTGQSDIVDADGIRGVLPGGAGWPFPWRPTHGLQTLEHPSPSDVVGTLSRVSPASATFPQRGELSKNIQTVKSLRLLLEFGRISFYFRATVGRYLSTEW